MDRLPKTWARAARAFGRDARGAAAIYTSLMILMLVAMVGLAVDVGRFFTTHSQAQAAADAAALAAAYQLDGTPTAITRARNAAFGTPLVQNRETFATNSEVVPILEPCFLHALPESDEKQLDPNCMDATYFTTDPSDARFVWIRTEALTHSNWFLVAAGASQTGRTAAQAVAGMTQVVCRIPPLMMCNPYETATQKSYPFERARGVSVLARMGGGTSAHWGPGNFGFLDSPEGNGAGALANALAHSTPRTC